MTGRGNVRAGTPAYTRLSLALVIAGLATFGLLYDVQSLLPVFADEFKVSPGGASLLVSFATGAMAVTLLVASVISDSVGRRGMIAASLLAASLLTLVFAALPDWHAMLVTRLLIGIALAGAPAVVMTYVAEEVHAESVGAAMGLYISGSAIGGMAGRLVVSVASDLVGWRLAIAGMGAVSLLGAGVFLWAAPRSQAFVPRRHRWASLLANVRILRDDAALPWLYAEGFLLMGAFVTIYNYVTFRLLAPPYSLSQSAVGAMFLLYILGSLSSAWFGRLAGQLGRRKVFWIPILIFLAGIATTIASSLGFIVAGIGVVTIGYFGAHSIASSWVSRRGGAARAQAAAFYLFFYYIGSSVAGTVGGAAWSRGGWTGITLFTGGLTVLALLVAMRLVAVRPLPENAVVDQSGIDQVQP